MGVDATSSEASHARFVGGWGISVDYGVFMSSMGEHSGAASFIASK